MNANTPKAYADGVFFDEIRIFMFFTVLNRR